MAAKNKTKKDGFLLCILAAAALALCFRLFVCKLVVVQQDGMSPVLHKGDVVVCLRSADILYGDIVLADTTDGSAFRRVIAMPGDTVTLSTDGGIIVNGTPLREDYAYGNMQRAPQGGDGYLLLPDNRQKEGALADREEIEGKVYAVVWPPEHFQILGK